MKDTFIRKLEHMGFYDNDGLFVLTDRSLGSDDFGFSEELLSSFNAWADEKRELVLKMAKEESVEVELDKSAIYGDVYVTILKDAT